MFLQDNLHDTKVTKKSAIKTAGVAISHNVVKIILSGAH